MARSARRVVVAVLHHPRAAGPARRTRLPPPSASSRPASTSSWPSPCATPSRCRRRRPARASSRSASSRARRRRATRPTSRPTSRPPSSSQPRDRGSGIIRSTRYIIPRNGTNAAADTPAQSHSAATSSSTSARRRQPHPRIDTTRSTTAIAGMRGCCSDMPASLHARRRDRRPRVGRPTVASTDRGVAQSGRARGLGP